MEQPQDDVHVVDTRGKYFLSSLDFLKDRHRTVYVFHPPYKPNDQGISDALRGAGYSMTTLTPSLEEYRTVYPSAKIENDTPENENEIIVDDIPDLSIEQYEKKPIPKPKPIKLNNPVWKWFAEMWNRFEWLVEIIIFLVVLFWVCIIGLLIRWIFFSGSKKTDAPPPQPIIIGQPPLLGPAPYPTNPQPVPAPVPVPVVPAAP